MKSYITVAFVIATASLSAFSQWQRDGVAATVNGEVITFSDVRQELAEMEKQAPAEFSDQERKLGRIGLLQEATRHLVEQELLYAEVKNRKLNLPKEYLDQRMQGLVNERFGGDWKTFNAYLVDSGRTLEDYRKIVSEQVGARLLVENLVNQSIVVTAQEIADYYRANPEQFRVPDRIRLSVIFLPRKAGETQAELDQRIAGIQKQLAAGVSFETLAKSYSADSTAADGGDLGWQAITNLSKLYQKAVTGVPPGALAPIIKEPAGAHILKVVDREAARTLPLTAAVKQKIDTILFQKQREGLYKKFIAGLREKYYVKNFVKTLEPANQ